MRRSSEGGLARLAEAARCHGLWAVLVALVTAVTAEAATAEGPPVPRGLHQKALSQGTVRVVVRLAAPLVPEDDLPDVSSVQRQRQGIAAAQGAVAARLHGTVHRLIHRYRTVPFVALEASGDALRALESRPGLVLSVDEDLVAKPLLAESVPLAAAPPAWSAGFDGAGLVIAVIDTGVSETHPFLAGKVVAEACFSSTTAGVSSTLCPNGQEQQIGPGAGVNCALARCDHGTHVAGIAAGNGAGAGVAFSGVARGASLMAIQVFSRFNDAADCFPSAAPCVQAYFSDIIAGLDHVYSMRTLVNFAAVNLSLGGGGFTSPCDTVDATHQALKAAIDQLRSARIATVIAAGNDGLVDEISSPACISSAVSVGSTDDGSSGTVTDRVSSFTNMASFLSLLAPGRWIASSVPGGGFANFAGTSMATPHVAGAFAVLKQKAPAASVSQLLGALQTTGLPVLDPPAGLTKPRIRVKAALDSLDPIVFQSLTPDGASPQRVGTAVTWTALVSGGTPPLAYQFFVRRLEDGGGFQVVQPWGPSAAVTFAPPLAGTYEIAVWVRSASGSAPEASGIAAAFAFTAASAPPPVTLQSLTPDRTSPQLAGTAVTWTALATGGTPPLAYQFFARRLEDGGGFQVVQPWGPSAAVTFAPPLAGTYEIAVWVRSAGGSAPETGGVAAAFAFTAASAPPPVTLQSLTPDRTSPQLAGTAVTWTALATGGTPPLAYQFFVRRLEDGGGFQAVQPWGPSAAVTLAPTLAGTYEVAVWIRSAGGSAPETGGVAAAFAFTAASAPPPVSLQSLTPDRTSPQLAGTAVTWTALATGGTPPLAYQFFVRRLEDGGGFQVVQPWGPSAAVTLAPVLAGTYEVAVWVRSAGGSAPEVGALAAPFTIVP